MQNRQIVNCQNANCALPTFVCPPDSRRVQPNSPRKNGKPSNNIVDDNCCANHCQCDYQKCEKLTLQCEPGFNRYLVASSSNHPGTCCDQFECREPEVRCKNVKCLDSTETYDVYASEDGTSCPTDSYRPTSYVPSGSCCPNIPQCRCRAAICPPAMKCGRGMLLLIEHKGEERPGRCCDLFRCVTIAKLIKDALYSSDNESHEDFNKKERNFSNELVRSTKSNDDIRVVQRENSLKNVRFGGSGFLKNESDEQRFNDDELIEINENSLANRRVLDSNNNHPTDSIDMTLSKEDNDWNWKEDDWRHAVATKHHQEKALRIINNLKIAIKPNNNKNRQNNHNAAAILNDNSPAVNGDTVVLENEKEAHVYANPFEFCTDEDDGRIYFEGERWHKGSCQTCLCNGGVALCRHMQCPKIAQDCSWVGIAQNECCPICLGCKDEDDKNRNVNDIWQKDDCTNCTCGKDFRWQCQKYICKQECENPRKIPGQCCPHCDEPLIVAPPSMCSSLELCTLRCTHGFLRNQWGCFECQCREGQPSSALGKAATTTTTTTTDINEEQEQKQQLSLNKSINFIKKYSPDNQRKNDENLIKIKNNSSRNYHTNYASNEAHEGNVHADYIDVMDSIIAHDIPGTSEPEVFDEELPSCKPLTANNCRKQCAHGYMRDERNCALCKCALCPSSERCPKQCLYGFATNTVGCPICECLDDLQSSTSGLCHHGGNAYRIGEEFRDGACRNCTCRLAGRLECVEVECNVSKSDFKLYSFGIGSAETVVFPQQHSEQHLPPYRSTIITSTRQTPPPPPHYYNNNVSGISSGSNSATFLLCSAVLFSFLFLLIAAIWLLLLWKCSKQNHKNRKKLKLNQYEQERTSLLCCASILSAFGQKPAASEQQKNERKNFKTERCLITISSDPNFVVNGATTTVTNHTDENERFDAKTKRARPYTNATFRYHSASQSLIRDANSQ